MSKNQKALLVLIALCGAAAFFFWKRKPESGVLVDEITIDDTSAGDEAAAVIDEAESTPEGVMILGEPEITYGDIDVDPELDSLLISG